MNCPKIGVAHWDDGAVRLGAASLHHGDALNVYDSWLPPTLIILDGPYGASGNSQVNPVTRTI